MHMYLDVSCQNDESPSEPFGVAMNDENTVISLGSTHDRPFLAQGQKSASS